MAREMLEGEGYGILEALNAEQAVRVATGYAGRFILLLTDVVMPGASGQDLAQQLGLQRPAMKVLYMSAFSFVKGQQQFSDAESGLELSAPIILKLHHRAPHGESAGGTNDEAGLSLTDRRIP